MQPKPVNSISQRGYNFWIRFMHKMGLADQLAADPLLYLVSDPDDDLEATQEMPAVEDETQPEVVHLRNPNTGRVVSLTRDSQSHKNLLDAGYTEI